MSCNYFCPLSRWCQNSTGGASRSDGLIYWSFWRENLVQLVVEQSIIIKVSFEKKWQSSKNNDLMNLVGVESDANKRDGAVQTSMVLRTMRRRMTMAFDVAI